MSSSNKYKSMEEGQSEYPVAAAVSNDQPYPATMTATPAEQQNYVPTANVSYAPDGENVVQIVYVASAPLPQKMGFVRKVFGLLAIQLLVTFSIILAFFLPGCPTPGVNGTENCTDSSPRAVVSQSVWIIWVALVAWFGIYVGCVFAQMKCRTPPGNYLLLGFFTIATGTFLGILSCYSTLVEVVIAIALTILISVSIIGVTTCSFNNGFVGPAPYLLVGFIAIFWTCMMLVPFAFGPWAWYTYHNVLWSGLGVLLFSLFIVYDTTIILSGSHRKHRFAMHDVCLAAMSLYMDIVGLLICLLSGGRR